MSTRVHPNLKNCLKYNPTDFSHTYSIENLNKEIKVGKITIPIYQRDLSWTVQKCVDLFNFQLFGKSAISAISILEADDKNTVKQISFISRKELNDEELVGSYKSVIDGQQRLSANFMAYIGDEYLQNIYLDLGRGKFRIILDERLRDTFVPVNILLNEDRNLINNFIVEKKYDSEAEYIIKDIRTKLFSYKYTVNMAKSLTIDEQIEWFKVLNNAGSNVTETQITLAKIHDKGVDIYVDYIRKFNDIISDKEISFKNTKMTSFHNNAITALNIPVMKILKKDFGLNFTPIPSDTKATLLEKLTASELQYAFDITLAALEKSLNFIEDNKLFSPDRIDYINYMLSFFIYNEKLDESSYKDYLIRWYKTIKFNDLSNSKRREAFKNLITLV